MQITRVQIRHYRDNGQTTAYITWADGATEGPPAQRLRRPSLARLRRLRPSDFGPHMCALLQRAARDGIAIELEIW